jgi:hypothetical protein
MGYELSREVTAFLLSPAGSTLSPAERLVLYAIAERAPRATRVARQGGQDDWRLDRIVGVRLSDVLSRLARRGIDVRCPVGYDSAGRPMYGGRGRAAVYWLPALVACDELSTRRLAPDRTEAKNPSAPDRTEANQPIAPDRTVSKMFDHTGASIASAGASIASAGADPYRSSPYNPGHPCDHPEAYPQHVAPGTCQNCDMPIHTHQATPQAA